MHEGHLALMIPIISVISLALMIIFLRSYENRERMAMIERGLNPGDFRRQWRFSNLDPHRSVRIACTAIGIGVGLFLGNIMRSFDFLDKGGIVWGTICICGGLGLLIGHFIQQGLTKNEKKVEEDI
jgi:hypothetical protein